MASCAEAGRPNTPTTGCTTSEKSAIVHPDGIGVRAGVERHVGLADQALVHEDALEVQVSEGWHRAQLAVWIQLLEFLLACQAKGTCAGQKAQLLEVEHERGRKDRQDRLVVGDADHDFRPRAARHVGDRRLALSGKGFRMLEGGVRNASLPEELVK